MQGLRGLDKRLRDLRRRCRRLPRFIEKVYNAKRLRSATSPPTSSKTSWSSKQLRSDSPWSSCKGSLQIASTCCRYPWCRRQTATHRLLCGRRPDPFGRRCSHWSIAAACSRMGLQSNSRCNISVEDTYNIFYFDLDKILSN